MYNRKKIVVVMPAYNAEATLVRTYQEIDRRLVDEVILVDDASRDRTVEVARRLGLRVLVHPRNRGYGGNQKTCYLEALRLGADIVVMVHPDYQYTPLLIPAMATMITSGVYDCVIGSRILGGQARSGGMPTYKYYFNRMLTLAQNVLMGSKLSEFHTGYRAFSREVLERLPLGENSDDFVFDNQMLAQIIASGFRIGEVSCPTRYFAEASSIGFRRSVIYGLGVLETAWRYRLHRWGLRRDRLFDEGGLRLDPCGSDGLGAPLLAENGDRYCPK
ncbi:Glycosyl transferase family 2 [Singulisphaera sp. GP187]|uniref:glycosyltransferase family 2 protein n=1 Tax=Singulisphaera sp. GP187 TaxID=1882752 RepID=UPI00092C0226|nr:glycosyltransferase family 2 protein [Singulisphaera sp. GP187]SIO16459.1 Glycosyl transferase family 2 [Singulisphaera sp. GP187]